MAHATGDERLVEQATSRPTRKVTMGTVKGTPLAIIIAWGAAQLGLEMPIEVAVAFGALISQGVSYLSRERA